MSTPATTERLAAIIGEHTPVYDYRNGHFTMECEACDFKLGGIDREDAKARFGQHFAAVLADAGVGFVAEAQAEALREAAHDVMDECRHSSEPCFCGSANWLSERADRIGGAS